MTTAMIMLAATTRPLRSFLATSFKLGPNLSASSPSFQEARRSAATLLSCQVNDAVKKKREAGREKRKKFIGLAKAVDRGQYQAYNPLKNGKFVAESGLPEAIRGGGTFTVLGIESSCDDTGGELMYRVLMTLSVVVTFCVLMM